MNGSFIEFNFTIITLEVDNKTDWKFSLLQRQEHKLNQTVINRILYLNTMPNWDDQFDFDDLEDNAAKNKPKTKANEKKYNHNHDDFFDDQEEDNKNKPNKHLLPTINNRNSASSKKIQKSPQPKLNPYADKSFGSKHLMDDDDFEEQIVDQIPQKKPQLPPKQQQPKVKQQKSAQNFTKIKVEQSNDYEDEYLDNHEEERFHEQPKKQNNTKNNKSKTQSAVPQMQKRIEDSYVSNKIQQQQQPDDYEQEFQHQDYQDDDFEQEDHSSPVKKSQKKIQQKRSLKIQHKQEFKMPSISNLSNKNLQLPPKNNNLTTNQMKTKDTVPRSQSIAPPKPPNQDKKISTQDLKYKKNTNKIESRSVSKPLQRSSSRQSIRSNAEKSIKGSRVSQKNNESEFFPNRHSDIVAKSFPDDDDKINNLSQFDINKINQRMRAMIRKFNDELNDLINKNMLLLRNKGNEKNQNIEDKVRELQIQKKSGETAIQVMDKDLEKLHGRAGELKQEEYQLILERQIDQKKGQIKQTLKQITNMKRDVDTRGKKLAIKQTEQKNAQNIHHLKAILIQSKKDEEKGDERIQKLTSSHEDLETKLSDMDYKLDELISQARQKGVNIDNNEQLQKRFVELKAKLQISKNFNKKTQGLISTKIDILNHQNQQIKITIRNISSQIHNLYGSIDHSQGQAIKLIQKAKEKQGISPLFAESLDKLLKQIEQTRANNDLYENKSEVKSKRSDTAKQKSGKFPKEETIEKSLPLRVTQSQNKLIDVQQNANKPKFTKKKPGEQHKILEIQNKSQVQERVWNNSDENKPKLNKNDENKRSIGELPRKQLQKEKIQILEEQKKDKSKPFMLRKSKPTQNKDQKSVESNNSMPINQKLIQQPNLNKHVEKQEQKKEQAPTVILAPRMMRFGRKRNEDTSSQSNIPVKDNQQPEKVLDRKQDVKLNPPAPKNEVLKIDLSEPVAKKQQDKPIFVPKRFNLRNKVERKDDSYTPSVQKDSSYASPQGGNVQKSQSPKQAVKEEYKPNFNFKNEQLKPKEEPVIKKQVEKPIAQESEVKPRFNLRLRDRAPKNNEEQGYSLSIGQVKATSFQSNIPPDNKKNDIKVEMKVNIEFVPQKQSNSKSVERPTLTNSYNPYAPKIQPITVQKESARKVQNTPINPVGNPYAAKFQAGEGQTAAIEPPKRERGPVKKNKIASNVPKEPFNIYAQADDITNEIKQIGGSQQPNKNTFEPQTNKKQEVNLNELLGIKKETKKNDFDDLLGDVGGVKLKNKKKNNDFFNDLQF